MIAYSTKSCSRTVDDEVAVIHTVHTDYTVWPCSYLEWWNVKCSTHVSLSMFYNVKKTIFYIYIIKYIYTYIYTNIIYTHSDKTVEIDY